MLKKLFKFRKKEKIESLEVYLTDAIETFENGNYEDAVGQFAMITKAFPDHPLAHLMYGRALIELGEFELAIEALFEHLKLVPDSVEALIYLGLTYYECGKVDRAVERYEQALKLKKNSVLIRENLAITLLSAGELGDALDELVVLHEESPDDTEITELLIIALGRLGRWEAAKQYVHEMESGDLVLGCD